jgi:glycosyltransferase involved in cell wall biosynthesis
MDKSLKSHYYYGEFIVSKLVVAIPAYNEEQSIGRVITNILNEKHHLPDLQILVIDDGSTDNTANVAIDAGADVVVGHTANLGVSSAYSTGICLSLYCGADIICFIDADNQFDSSEIEKVIEPVLVGLADLVIGSRFVSRNNTKRIPILNSVANRTMSRFLSIFLGFRVYDVESGFRAISKEAAAKLELLGIGSFSHDMLLDLVSKGFRVHEVPVNVRYFQDRISRVIKGFLRYGFKSLFSILMKSLVIRGHLSNIGKNPQSVRIVYKSPKVRLDKSESVIVAKRVRLVNDIEVCS